MKPKISMPASYTTIWRRSFLVEVCEGPADVLRIWKGKTLIYDVNNTDLDDLDNITIFRGDGITTPDSLITGKNPDDIYSKYTNKCCIFFDNYDLGQSGVIPNFTFEVTKECPEYGNPEAPAGYTAITTIEELQAIGDYATGNYALVNDIDASDTVNWNGGLGFDPLPGFGGNFKGQGWKISNLFINRPTETYVGLFSSTSIAVSKEISQLYLENVDITGDTTVGALIGQLRGGYTISYCKSSGDVLADRAEVGGLIGGIYLDYARTVIIDSCSSTCDIGSASGVDFVGGLIGSASCTITGASIEIKNSYSKDGTVIETSPAFNVGGFIGFASHDVDEGGVFIHDCFSMGTHVQAADNVGGFIGYANLRALIQDCFCVNTVTAATDKGGFCGLNNTSTITNCFYDSTVSGLSDDDGRGEPKTTAEMKTESTFTDWDFDDVWHIFEDEYYPNLRTHDIYWLTGDVNPAHVLKDMCVNTQYGAEMSLLNIDYDSFFEIWQHCNLKSYHFAFVLDSQQPLLDWIDTINSYFKGYRIMSSGKIGIGCFKDEGPIEPAITENYIKKEEGENQPPPIDIVPRDYKETYNRIEVEYTNRAADYDTGYANAKDTVDQQISGKVRAKSLKLDGITNGQLAQEIAYRQLFEAMYRFNSYPFNLSYKSMALQVGDVKELSDGESIVAERVRIVSIGEAKDGKNLAVQAVEDKPYMYNKMKYKTAASQRAIAEPVLLKEPEIEFVEDPMEPVLGVCIIPQDTYMAEVPGFLVYMSWEEAGEYECIGTHGAACVKGTLTSALEAYTATIWTPDDYFTVDVGDYGDLEVDNSDDAFFNNASLCKIGDEIVGFKTSERVGATNEFTVSNLIRGIGNTEPIVHAISADFVSISNAYRISYTLNDIGRTIWIKIIPFYGGAYLELEDMTAVSHIITGEYRKPANTSLIRVNGNEGYPRYTGATVTVDYYFGNKQSGFNVGGANNELGDIWEYGDDTDDLLANDGILFGAYNFDTNIERIIVKAFEDDYTLIGEWSYVAGDSEFDDEQVVFTYAGTGELCLNSKNPVRIQIIAATSLQSTIKSEVRLVRYT
jgi:archaellum component FlaG (FlaF/FlaG flagellin family)